MIIEAPTYYEPDDAPTLFLAGGITGCSEWQSTAISLLRDTDITIFNPRRADFPIHDPDAAEAQITWEHHHLRMATAILFWFPEEEIQPIALYELGAWSMTDKPLAVGTRPHYERRQDVVIQTRLARPEVIVRTTLAHTISEAVMAIAAYVPPTGTE